jgi:hypothetical protein
VAVVVVVVPLPLVSAEGTAGNFEGAPTTSSTATIMEGTQLPSPLSLFLLMMERGHSSVAPSQWGGRRHQSKERAINIIVVVVVALMGGRDS